MDLPGLGVDVAIDTERLERKLRVMVKHYGALADELKHIDEDCLREELQNPELVHTCAHCGRIIHVFDADIARVEVDGNKVYCGDWKACRARAQAANRD